MEDEGKAESDVLARQLAEARRQANPNPNRKPDGLAAQGMRIGIELVAGVVVGLGLGLLFDRWFDTKPVFLIIFLLLGFAGGFLNVFRALNGLGMGLGYNKHPRRPPQDR